MTAHPWSSGFRSLEEEHSYSIAEIEGEVPRGLRGTLYRNGSGRNQLVGQWFPHWFDGDGMITAVRFDEAGVHFRNRYGPTPSYRDATEAGRILNRGFGKIRPGGAWANALRQPANRSDPAGVMQSG